MIQEMASLQEMELQQSGNAGESSTRTVTVTTGLHCCTQNSRAQNGPLPKLRKRDSKRNDLVVPSLLPSASNNSTHNFECPMKAWLGSQQQEQLSNEELPFQLMIDHDIYVRKCYPELLILICQRIDELLNSGIHTSTIRVTGTPGMGKSYLLGYVWYHLLKIECDVVARVGPNVIKSQKGSKEAYEITFDEYRRLSSERNVIFLVDPSTGGVVFPTKGITIFFVSPSNESPRVYARTEWLNLFMPPWRKEELQCCIRKIYPKCELDFESQFEKWGGSIRSLSRPLSETSRRALLNRFLRNRCLIDIVNGQEDDSGILTNDVQQFQWLVHMIPIENDDGSTNYEDVTLSFPSHFISLQVAQRIRNLRFDWKTLGQPRLLGNAYESHVLDVLFKVSEEEYLSVKAMKVNETQEVSIPAVKRHMVFSSKNLIKHPEAGTLYIPIEPNRPGIDLVMPPWIFQVTITKSHTAKKLEKTLNQFPSIEKWEMCFVLPSVIVDEFSIPKLSSYPSIQCVYKLKFDFDSY